MWKTNQERYMVHRSTARLRGTPEPPAQKNLAAVERSLERYPWATLSDKRGERREITVFGDDGKAWVVTTKAAALPGPFAADVWVALAHRYNQSERPPTGEVVVPVAQLLRTMQREYSGGTLNAVARAVHALNAVRIVAVGTWRKKQSITLTLGTAALDGTVLRFRFGEAVRDAFAAGEYRLLDVDRYFALESPTARRLYRYLDYRRWKGQEQQLAMRVSVAQVAQELPVRRSSPSHILRTLEPAHHELRRFGILSLAELAPIHELQKRRPDYWMRYVFENAQVRQVQPHLPPRTPDYQELVKLCVTTLRDAPSTAFYMQVAKTLPEDMIRNILGGVREMMQGEKPVTVDAARKIFTVTVRSRGKHLGLTL